MTVHRPPDRQSAPQAYECKIQGVPEVRSSKFMHHNFWSKLHFYMKCWKMFISLLSTCIQNFSYWHALFVFLSHSVAVAAWSRIQLVDPQMIYFEFFYHLVRKGQFNPQTIFVYLFSLGSWKNIILGIHPKKIIIPTSFHSKILYFSTNLRRAGRYLAD